MTLPDSPASAALPAPGTERGPSSWYDMTQAEVDAFARLTRDEQWIHVDPQRAGAGPFGTTIAHGYLTLSLIAHWIDELFPVPPGLACLNYGLNKVRVPAPVPVGSRLRMTARLDSVRPLAGGVELVWHCQVDREGGTKPVCVADSVLRYTNAV
jgi:acyl dehydratase